MNKKILMPIALLLLVGIAGFVYAIASDYESKVVTINLRQGWNLVPLIYDYHIIEDTSGIKLQDIEVAYIYSPIKKDYVKYIEKGNILGKGDSNFWKAEEVIREIVSSKQSLFVSDSNVRNLMFGTSSWIYVKKSGTLVLTTTRDKSGDKILLQGWNFLTITPEFEEKSLNDLKGTCIIEKFYLYVGEGNNNGWTENMADFLSSRMIDDDWVGQGAVIKVSNDCKLGESVTNPPTIPN